MIDSSDGDFFLTFALILGRGIIAVAVLAFAIMLYCVAFSNTLECEQSACTVGVAKLLDHECVCVVTPGSK